VKLDIWRQGAAKELTAQLANANDKSAQVASKQGAPSQGKLGLALRPLQPEEKQGAGIDGGMVVQQASGPSAMAGVQPGDVLISVNGIPATSVDQVRGAVAKSDKSVALLIQRGRSKIFVPVNIG
jgi:serine protease Do